MYKTVQSAEQIVDFMYKSHICIINLILNNNYTYQMHLVNYIVFLQTREPSFISNQTFG